MERQRSPREKRKKYDVLGNLTPVPVLSLSLCGIPRGTVRLTDLLGPTGRHGEPEGEGARESTERGSAHAERQDGPAIAGITIYIVLLCLCIMYVHVLNQLFKQYGDPNG